MYCELTAYENEIGTHPGLITGADFALIKKKTETKFIVYYACW